MGGFNTLIFVGNPKAVGTTYTATWDDQLNVAVAVHNASTGTCDSNGPANRANWSDQDRIISVYKAQGCDFHYGGTVSFYLYDSTASVTIYTASFGSLAARATGNLTGNPLATYTLPVNNVLKMANSGSGSIACGAAILFSSVPSGAATFDFNGSSDLAADGILRSSNVAYTPTAHTAVIASFVAQKSLQIWKIEFANASDTNPPVACVSLSITYSFKLYNSSDSVTIYTVTNGSISANGVQSIIGTPLTTYTLPANKNISIDISSYGTPGAPEDDYLAVGMAMSCT